MLKRTGHRLRPPQDTTGHLLVDTMYCQTIHFIGIGGAGMSGIAELLLRFGYTVTGSDLHRRPITEQLERLGARITYTHDAALVQGAEVVVYSSAINTDNPELVRARQLHLPVLLRAQMLAEIMRFSVGIAVAGTHGKTTTTSLLSYILLDNGLDPTYVIGGILQNVQHSARLGSGRFFVVEADESDGSFLRFQPVMSVITNIDRDHLSNYHGQLSCLQEAFVQFIQQLPFYGLAALCFDDTNLRQLLDRLDRRIITYGFSDGAEVQLSHFVQQGFSTRFQLTWPAQQLDHYPISCPLTGRHNALNSTAAIILAMAGCQLSIEQVARSLQRFQGVGRRMEQHGYLTLPSGGQVLVVEDYGHHPREIQVTMEALRAACPQRRLVMAFQPHRYTRTQELWSEFITVLSQPDLLILTDIYTAGEVPLPQINSAHLASALRQTKNAHAYRTGNNDNDYNDDNCYGVYHFPTAQVAAAQLPTLLRDGDILLIQGAGNINQIAPLLIAHN